MTMHCRSCGAEATAEPDGCGDLGCCGVVWRRACELSCPHAKATLYDTSDLCDDDLDPCVVCRPETSPRAILAASSSQEDYARRLEEAGLVAEAEVVWAAIEVS